MVRISVIHGGNDEGDRFMQDGGWSSRRLVGLVGGLVARQWAQCTRRGALKARCDASCIDRGNRYGSIGRDRIQGEMAERSKAPD